MFVGQVATLSMNKIYVHYMESLGNRSKNLNSLMFGEGKADQTLWQSKIKTKFPRKFFELDVPYMVIGFAS